MDSISVGALAAAKRVAEAHGIAVTDTEVLADRSSLLVHLKPSPVMARVATTTALLRRPVGAWLARDLAVVRFLHAAGAPVVPPSRELPPGPHHADGYVITYWEWVEADRNSAPTAAEAVPLLKELHGALAGYTAETPDGELPYLGVVLDEIPRWLKFLETRHTLGGMDLIGLREAHWRLEATLKERARHAQPLHGDAHRSNLLRTPQGLLWTDFEDACLGPVAWDLACLLRTAAGGEEALPLSLCPDAPGWEELTPYMEARTLEAVVYAQVLAVRFPANRAGAAEQLAAWRKTFALRSASGQ